MRAVNGTYVRIVSWHIVKTPTRDAYVTLCGKRAEGTPRDEFPFDEKTCEVCLRLNSRLLLRRLDGQ